MKLKTINLLILVLVLLTTPVFAQETTTVVGTDKDESDPYRSPDFKMFASISEDLLLNKRLTGDPDIMGEGGFGFRIPSLLRAVTPNENDDDVMLAMSHIGNDSADWVI